MASILQTSQWAQFKASQGFEILNLDEVFIHKRNLPFGQNFLYVPEASANDLSAEQIAKLKEICQEQDSLFIRLELVDKFSSNANGMLIGMGFAKAFEEVQPKWRQIVSLEPDKDQILAQMKEKGRYNVRLAQKKGVVVKQFDMKDDKAQDALGVFYNLYQETYKREGITGRSLGYFQNLIDKFSQTDYLKLYISYFEDEPVSASLISECDGMASYLYGGSSRRHKEVMAPYLMHFFAMTEAKSRGCKSYDLIGRSAPGEEKSSWAGLTRFKESFGGEAVEILGSYDFINKKFLYGVFKFIEKIRRKH